MLKTGVRGLAWQTGNLIWSISRRNGGPCDKSNIAHTVLLLHARGYTFVNLDLCAF